MSHSYTATIRWTAEGDVLAGKYSRGHQLEFDGGIVVPASASPTIVPAPWSRAEAIDPEEAFVASLSSCHMLFFVDFARRAGFGAASYVDNAVGQMERGEDGRIWLSKVDLYPRVTWSTPAPADAEYEALHHKAHDACFIANSVKTEVIAHLG